MLLTCLFCKKEKKLFNICYVYGSTQRPIKEFILEFFGPVDEYLSNEQGLCSACVFVFNNLIFIQNVMRETIKLNVYSCHEYDTRYEVAYKKFLNHLNLINYDENRSDTESRSSSPELLKATRSSPFTQSNDEYNYNHYRTGTPAADYEVSTIFRRGRRKRRGHNWSRKRKLPSRSPSVKSEPVRNRTKARNRLFRSNTSERGNKSEYDDDSLKGGLRFENGCLLNKRTRSVSRLQDEMANQLTVGYECGHLGCSESFEDLTELTKHKMEAHQLLDKFWCYECYLTKFTTEEDLNEHNKLFHNSLVLHCSLCSIKLMSVDEVRKHYEDHRIHSVPCHYCDKFFLNKKDCSEHVEKNHKGKRRRIKNTRSLTILDRIDKYSDCDESGDEMPTRKKFVIKMLVQNQSDISQSTENILQEESTNGLHSEKYKTKIGKEKREVYVKCVKLEDENLEYILKNAKLSKDQMNLLIKAQGASRSSSNQQRNKNLFEEKPSSSENDTNRLEINSETCTEKTNVTEEDLSQKNLHLLTSKPSAEETNGGGENLSQKYSDLLMSTTLAEETNVAEEYLPQHNLNFSIPTDAINENVPSSTTNELNQIDVSTTDVVDVQDDNKLEFSECDPSIINSEFVIGCSNSDVEHKASKSEEEITSVSNNISDPMEAEVLVNLQDDTPESKNPLYVADSNNIDCVADTTVLFMVEQVAGIASEDQVEIVRVDPNEGDLEIGENCEIIQETQNVIEEKTVDSRRENNIFRVKRGKRRTKMDDVKSSCSTAVGNGQVDIDGIYEFRDEERDMEELSKISKFVQASVKTAKYQKHNKKNSHKRHPRKVKMLSSGKSTSEAEDDVKMDFIIENSKIKVTNVDDNLKPNLSNISKLKKSLDGMRLKGRKRKLL